MERNKIMELKKELGRVRESAVAAHIAGDRAAAECLTGKAVGMNSALQLAERAMTNKNDHEAIGELEGIERALARLSPIPKC